jgi:hypothetical protein
VARRNLNSQVVRKETQQSDKPNLNLPLEIDSIRVALDGLGNPPKNQKELVKRPLAVVIIFRGGRVGQRFGDRGEIRIGKCIIGWGGDTKGLFIRSERGIVERKRGAKRAAGRGTGELENTIWIVPGL